MKYDDPDSPVVKFRMVFFSFIVMPTMVALAWWKAPQFDPYTMSFLTKTYIAPSPGMPGELRIAGWVVIGIGALFGYAGLKGAIKRIGSLRDSLVLIWIACLFAALGGAFFVAAQSAQDRITEEQTQ